MTSYAFVFDSDGESLGYLKDQLGHSEITMTVDVYGYLVPGVNRAAVNRLPVLNQNVLAKNAQ